MATVFCIDTSSILEARTRSYPPDVFPAVWEKVEKLIADGRLCASVEVLHEIEKKDDDVKAWAKTQSGFFVPLDRTQTTEVTTLLRPFVHLVHNTKNRNSADAFVIALAKLRGYTVVSEEHRSGSPKKPKIPDMCDHFGVECITFLDLARCENWAF